MPKQKGAKVLKMFFRRRNVGTPTESVDCWTKEIRIEDFNKWHKPEILVKERE